MGSVRRPIDVNPIYLTDIPKIKEALENLPEEIRACSEHGEEVIISEYDFQTIAVNGPPPFAQIAFVGCCDAHIDKVIEGIRRAQGNM